jgi:hypothetical protein
MGFIEENLLAEDSFSKLMCSIDKFEELPPKRKKSVDTGKRGMFDMESDLDIVTGEYARGFFQPFLGENNKESERIKEELRLLKERYLFETL